MAEQVTDEAIFVACDSVLEFEGRTHDEPRTVEAMTAQWQRIRDYQGVLHMGHLVLARSGNETQQALCTASTVVKFADVINEKIAAYVTWGEPRWVAGAFTTNGLGGAFITGVEGDPHDMAGPSLPLLRQILPDLGVARPNLWRDGAEP